MISLFGVVFAVIFALVFGATFFSVIAGFWRMRGMTSKMFSLAERELERALREGSAAASTSVDSTPDAATCSHCGSRVVANVAQCPSCGAGLR